MFWLLINKWRFLLSFLRFICLLFGSLFFFATQTDQAGLRITVKNITHVVNELSLKVFYYYENWSKELFMNDEQLLVLMSS